MCNSLRTQQTTLSVVKKEVHDLKIKLTEAQRQNTEQENKLTAQDHVLEEQNERIAQQDKQIARVTSARRPDNANFLSVSDSNGNPLECVSTEACSESQNVEENEINNSLRSNDVTSCGPVTRKRKASSDTNISIPTTRSAKTKKSK